VRWGLLDWFDFGLGIKVVAAWVWNGFEKDGMIVFGFEDYFFFDGICRLS
jgi:hypothetical protein